MSDSLNRLLLKTSTEPERIIELLKAISMELSFPRDASGEAIDAVLEDFYLAMNLAEKLFQATAGQSRLESILDNMPMTMLMVSPEMEIQGLNGRAKSLLDNGKYLYQVGNRVHAASPQSQQQLDELIAQYAKPRSRALPPAALNIVTKDSDHEVIQCYIYQQSRFDFDEQKHVSDICLLLNDNQGAFYNQCVEQYASHFQLTKAETELLMLLTAGYSLNEIAEKRYVSINTARTQLKVILKKTGAKRQSNLIQQALTYSQTAFLPDTENQLTPHESLIYVLQDGRQVAYSDSGNESDDVIVLCHGVFTCRYDPVNFDTFIEHHARIIIPDRPGYGLSDPVSDSQGPQSFLDWVSDLLELMDGLSIERFTVMAGDFSSAYALAVAYKAPERVNNVVLLDGAAPVDSDLSQYEASIPAYYRATFFAARKLPKLVQKTTYVAYTYFSRDPEKALHRFIEIIGEENSRVVKNPTIFYKILQAVTEAVRQGITAVSCNQVMMFSNWNIPLQEIQSPVLLVVGESEPLSQYHSERLRRSLPSTTVVPLFGKGWASMMYEELPTVLKHWRLLSNKNNAGI